MDEPGGFVKMLKCGIDCCKYESKQAGKIKRHKANIHDIGVTWHKCDQDGCNYKCKEASNLKQHKTYIHDIGIIWHKCDQDGCNFKCKAASHLKQHKASIHDIGITWNKCDQDGCDYKCKEASNLKRHKANIHDIGITWHKCDQDGCDFKCKLTSVLKKHKAHIHDIGITWYKCDQDGCDFKCKQASILKQHKAHIHDIGITWNKCDQDGCNYKCKNAGNLKRHKANIHNIEVKWYKCDQDECDFKFKLAEHLKRHYEFVHDIGTNQCEYCCNNRNSKNRYLCKITGITSNICNGCYNKVTGKNTRKEKEWSDYLDKHLGINGLLSSDKNLKSVGGCQRYRPDKLYTDLNYVEIAECDEFQHRYSNTNYDCDERRISEIYEEDGIIGKNMAVLRWNPDNYTPKEGLKKLSRKERLKVYVELSKKLRQKTSHADKIHIYYLFYSEDNPRLSKNIPYTMIHDLDEISHI